MRVVRVEGSDGSVSSEGSEGSVSSEGIVCGY